jgi:hypothetical protein
MLKSITHVATLKVTSGIFAILADITTLLPVTRRAVVFGRVVLGM